MRKLNLIFCLTLLATNSKSLATLSDICELSKKPISSQIQEQVSKIDLEKYQNKLTNECELSKKYIRIQAKLASRYSVKLTDLAEYQAIRFVQRNWLSKAEAEQKPIESIYQIYKADYDKPFSEQSGAIWDDWAAGVKQLEPNIEVFKAGKKFDLAELKKIHRGLFPFYPLITEHGEFAHEPNPGVLKPTSSSDNDNYWWSITDKKEIDNTRRIVETENDTYLEMGLLTSQPKGMPSYVSQILSFREADNRDHSAGKIMALFSGHTMLNRENTELILDMIDQMISQARQGQHMIWKGHLFTAGELAYFVQQAYVRVHPFYEGNGRTSRFLQELILLSFNLPHGASGDLMDIDVLTKHDDYYTIALARNDRLLDKMNLCTEEFDRLKKDVRTIDPSLLSYGCRILENRSSIWAQLVQENEIKNSANYAKELERISQLNYFTDTNHSNELKRRKAIESNTENPGAQNTK